MEPYVRSLLDIMFSAGLSTVLVESLEQISTRYIVCNVLFIFSGSIENLLHFCIICYHFSIPSLLPTIQDRLLDSISMVLSKSHYPLGRPAASMSRGTVVNVPQQVSELSGPALVQLALQTLARFNFKVQCAYFLFFVMYPTCIFHFASDIFLHLLFVFNKSLDSGQRV